MKTEAIRETLKARLPERTDIDEMTFGAIDEYVLPVQFLWFLHCYVYINYDSADIVPIAWSKASEMTSIS